MISGSYLYCILEGNPALHVGNIGLFGKPATTVSYKDISAVVSSVPFKEMQPDAEAITAHQKVIEESRNYGTTLPVRFGIMFKSEEGVKQMLTKSYKDMRSKIVKLKDKDEFGLKIIVEKSDLKKFSANLPKNPEIEALRKKIKKSGEGTSYFIKMKMDEAIRNETYKKIEKLSEHIHGEVTKVSQGSCVLRSDFDQIFLNASYLIDRDDITKFHKKLDDLKNEFQKDGLIFHISGPWAPYSFC